MRRVIFAALCAAALMAVAGPASAATNGQLVAVGAGIVTLNPDGSGIVTRWDPGAGHRLTHPKWSPDGNTIVFADSGHIVLFDLASGQARALTAGTSDSAPAWSPDGQRIAFGRDTQLLTMKRDGSDVQPLAALGEEVRALAWAPDDSELAVITTDRLWSVPLDGSSPAIRVPIGARGSVSWAPDSSRLVYGAENGASTEVRFLPGIAVATGTEPAFSPDGRRLVFANFAEGFTPTLRTMTIGDPASLAAVPQTWRTQLGDPDWQPCVAGATVSCVSPGWHCPDATLSVVAGKIVTTEPLCPGATRITVVDKPVGPGWSAGVSTATGRMVVRAPTTFAGTALVHFRATRGSETSELGTLTLNVTPPPAAPKLNVIGQPRLDRHGRVVLRAVCDRACSVSLRVIIRLNSQRVLRGRIVKGSAPAGKTLRLRLQRAKLPRHRRIAAARIAGTLTGPDGLHRNFTLSLIP